MAHPEIELWAEHEKSPARPCKLFCPSTETLTNRGITNRGINKMMQQLFMKHKLCLLKPYLIFTKRIKANTKKMLLYLTFISQSADA
jgi:ATP-dependent DNA helicase RecG